MDCDDQPERLDLEAERAQWFARAVRGETLVVPKDWYGIGFEETRRFARELKAVAGANRVTDLYSAMVD